jgi:hypothetical protein
MDHEKSLGEGLDEHDDEYYLAAKERFEARTQNVHDRRSWHDLLPAQQRAWISSMKSAADRKRAIRRDVAIQIAVAAEPAWTASGAEKAQQRGKALGRYALAAADKILE